MLLIIGYTAYKSRERPPPHWSQFGPLYCTVLAGLFIMAEPTRHVVMDQGWWSEVSLSSRVQYNTQRHCVPC